MRVLLADDDATLLRGLSRMMLISGFEPVCCSSGDEALRILCGESAPPLGILDWMMSGLTGPEVCRRVRQADLRIQPYLIVLTVKTDIRDVATALDAGANDHVRKPFSVVELKARVRVGQRVTELQADLRSRIGEAGAAQARADALGELLPVCARCRKVRDDADYLRRVEAYLDRPDNASFAFGICPGCRAAAGAGPQGEPA